MEEGREAWRSVRQENAESQPDKRVKEATGVILSTLFFRPAGLSSSIGQET
jgi:hypothetical protein